MLNPTVAGHNRLDDGFAAACKKLSIQDFSDVLDLIIDGLAKQGLEKTSLCDLIHLSGILVHDAPEGEPKFASILITTDAYVTFRYIKDYARACQSCT